MPWRERLGRAHASSAVHGAIRALAHASWLDARAHGGRWLVRIEDVDTPRCVPGADAVILSQLAACALLPDDAPVYQSQRGDLYQTALDTLVAAGQAYPCSCSRRDIEAAWAARDVARPRHGELVYPGTCRAGLHGRPARAWRLRTDGQPPVLWRDRRLGAQTQDVGAEVGDFVLRRADGLWAYQLAVVVDDAAQDVTHIVRGEDLADNTPRQILLQHALGLPQPVYLHTPLVLGPNGEKLSKQNGAMPLDTSAPLACLQAAGRTLGLPPLEASQVSDWLLGATAAWARFMG